MDRMGRVVLPKALRRHFGLKQGSFLELHVAEDQILLKAVREESPLLEENGLLVHEGLPLAGVEEAVETSRSARDRENWALSNE